MVTINCTESCGAAKKPPQSYRAFCAGNNFERYAYQYFVLVNCNVNIPDPTDVTAWAALVASGDIRIGPKGNLNENAPNVVTSNEVDPCAGATAMEITKQWTFITYQSEELDTDYFANLLADHSNFRMMIFDCTEKVALPDDYVAFVDDPLGPAPTGNPGFQFTISQPPFQDRGEGNMKRWNMTFDFVFPGNFMPRERIIPGLFAELSKAAAA